MANVLSNIVEHPKTSIAGVLIGAVTIAGVLSQQGITLGNAGSGTVVTLIAGIASALLGLLAKDPGSASVPPGPTTKLGAVLLVMGIGAMGLAGCSQATVADLIGVAGDSIVSILTLEGKTELAASAKTVTSSLVTLAANWKPGDPDADIVSGLNVLEVDAGTIPGESVYQPLVVIAVGTLESVIDDLASKQGQTPALTAHIASRKVTLVNPPKTKGEYRKLYNAAIDAHGIPAKAKI